MNPELRIALRGLISWRAMRFPSPMLLALVLLAAFAVRVGDMFWHPWAPDEGFSVELASGSWGELVRRTAADTHPPFYYALLKVWFGIVGAGLFRAKLLSILFAVATLLPVFYFARLLYGVRAAWLAVVFAAFLPYPVYWSHTARMHLVLPLFVMLIIYYSCRFLTTGALREWMFVAVAWIFAIQTNYMALVVGAVWGAAFLLAEPSPWRLRFRLALAPLPGLLLFLPWVPVLRAHATSSPMTIPFFQEHMSPGSLYYHAVFGWMKHEQGNQPQWFLLPAGLVFAVVLVLGARAVGKRWSIWVLLIGLPGLPMIIALVRDLTLAERHLHFCVPFFLTYWGAGVDQTLKYLREKVRGNAGDAGGGDRPA